MYCDTQTLSGADSAAFTEKRDFSGKVRKSVYTKGNQTNNYSYTYETNQAGKEIPGGNVKKVELAGKFTSNNWHDDFGRLSSKYFESGQFQMDTQYYYSSGYYGALYEVIYYLPDGNQTAQK